MLSRTKKFIAIITIAIIAAFVMYFFWYSRDPLQINAGRIVKVEFIRRWGDGTEEPPIELPDPVRGKVLKVLTNASASPLALLFKEQYAMSGDLNIYFDNASLMTVHVLFGERVIKDHQHYGVSEPILDIISAVAPSATQYYPPTTLPVISPMTSPASIWP